MPIRKEAAYIGLAENSELRYDVVDRTPSSEDYFQVTEFPETLTAGKNVFKFRGNPDTLVDDSKVHIEILDYNGDPIYYEVLRYLEKDGTRVLAVYIYPDTPEGRATIYLGGRVRYDAERGTNFPYSSDAMSDNWKDLPNLLWLRESRVAPNRRNSSEIIMLQQPKVTIKEEVKTFSEITDLPTFFNVVKGNISDGKSISGTGPGAGYTTLTVTTTTNQMTDIAGMPVSPIAEASFTSRTPSRGSAAISIALPSSLANAPAVIGNTSAVNSNAISSTTGLSTSALNTATTNVGNSGPGGTTIGRLPPPMPVFTSPANSTATSQNNVNDSATVEDTTVTSVSTLVFNPPDTTTISVTGFPLTSSHHLGATVIINQPKVSVASDTHLDSDGRVVHKTATNTTTGGGQRRVDCTYVGTIVDIENSTTAKLHPPFDFNSGRTSKPEGEHIIDFNASEFTMSYWVPQMTSDTENSMSFANIVLNNIEPATGDIYSVKTSYKLMGAPGDYIDAGNTILEKTDLLIDRTNTSPDIILGVKDTSMGEFISQTRIDAYWNKGVGTTATFDNDTSSESVLLEGDIGTNLDKLVFNIKEFYAPTLYKDTEYQLSFFAKGFTSQSMNPLNTSEKDLRMDVYISGSAGEASTLRPIKEYHGGMLGAPLETSNEALTDISLGQYLGTVEIDANTANIGNIVQFVPEDTDNYVLKFVVRKGKMYLKNVQLTANIETGFSPNTTEMNVRIPTDKMNAPVAFKFQYLDYLGAPAEVETFAQGAIFDGDNVYIEGDGNLLSGSVFIGNSVGSGIELAGVRSAFIRSVGYEGFTSASRTDRPGGFMIFTGSILPDAPDDYANLGTGLELVQDSSSFFRFNTVNGLDIRAKTFFIGDTDSQFISGSQGEIEISSSLFHLDPANNILVIGADAVINADLSVNQIFTPAGTTAADARAFINSSGAAKFAGDGAGAYKAEFNEDGTATVAGWSLGTEEFRGGNITISSSGEIKTTNFISSMVGGLAGGGYRIGADGIAEFEEARIRGTLSTAVFEKETVSAVGGALIVANATALASGSNILSNIANLNIATQVDDATIDSPTQVTFNSTAGVDRVKPITPQSGPHELVAGRTYRAKATISSYAGSNTIGFSNEGGIDTDTGRRSSNGDIETTFVFSGTGDVHVFSNSSNTGVISNITIEEMSLPVDNAAGFAAGEYILAKATSSLGFTEEIMEIASVDTATNTLVVSRSRNDNLIVSMSAGQVLVSQGKQDTGFILLNATSGSETPYIDITERTGSGVNDLDVKVRLGDLSGVSDTQFGTLSGFGLYTDNVFLKGTISASAGQLGAFNIDGTDLHSLDSGAPNNAPNDGIVISGSGGPNNRMVIDIYDGTTKVVSLGNYSSGKDGLFASNGDIGGWDIDPTKLEAGSGASKIVLSPGVGIHMGADAFASAPFSVTTAGVIKSTSGTIGGFTLGATQLSAGSSGTAQISLDSSTPLLQMGDPSGEHIDLTAGQLRFHNGSGTEVFRFDASIPTGQNRSNNGAGGVAANCTAANVNSTTRSGLEIFSKTTGLFFATPTTTVTDYRSIDFMPGRFFMEGGKKMNSNSNTVAHTMEVRRYFDCTTANTAGDLAGTTSAIKGKYEASGVSVSGTKCGVIGESIKNLGAATSMGVKGVATGTGTLYGVHSTGNMKSTGTISATNNITAYSSDGRLKENIVQISHPLEKIKQLRGVIYDWKEEVYKMGFTPMGDGKQEMGLIAQEVQKVIPCAVTTAPFDTPLIESDDGERWDGNPNHNPDDPYLTVAYDRIVPLLVESINAQQKLIEEMQDKIKKLEKN